MLPPPARLDPRSPGEEPGCDRTFPKDRGLVFRNTSTAPWSQLQRRLYAISNRGSKSGGNAGRTLNVRMGFIGISRWAAFCSGQAGCTSTHGTLLAGADLRLWLVPQSVSSKGHACARIGSCFLEVRPRFGLQRWQAARVSQNHGTGRVGSGLRDLRINGLFDFRHWPALACWIAHPKVIVRLCDVACLRILAPKMSGFPPGGRPCPTNCRLLPGGILSAVPSGYPATVALSLSTNVCGRSPRCPILDQSNLRNCWMPPTFMIGRTIRFLAGLIVMARSARMVRSRLCRLR